MTNQPRVIVIGIDGATWELIKPWIDEGKLPTFKKLMSEGAWGTLESTEPPVTFPAWASLFTGLDPSDLGVYYFVQVDVRNRRFILNSVHSFKGKNVWDILSDHGYKCCIVNVPTSKIHKINGVIVGGPFSGNKVAYPPEIEKVLDKMRYQVYPILLTKTFQENLEPHFELVRKTISSRFELTKYLIEKEKPDFVVLVIFTIDNLQHFYWDRKILLKSWEHLDKELYSFISRYKDSYIMLVSDHGFTKHRETFFISKFLEDRRLLVYKKINKLKLIILNTIFKKIFKITLNFVSKFIEQHDANKLFMGTRKIKIGFGNELDNLIDWEKSICIPIGSAIYLNCPDSQKDYYKNMLKTELEKLKDIIDRVFFREEVYTGKYAELAPDIIVKPKKGICITDTPYSRNVICDSHPRGWKAVHAYEGIFLIKGPGITPISNINVSVFDVAPTILHLFGIKQHSKMRGRPLTEIIGESTKIREKHIQEITKIRRSIYRLINKF